MRRQNTDSQFRLLRCSGIRYARFASYAFVRNYCPRAQGRQSEQGSSERLRPFGRIRESSGSQPSLGRIVRRRMTRFVHRFPRRLLQRDYRKARQGFRTHPFRNQYGRPRPQRTRSENPHGHNQRSHARPHGGRFLRRFRRLGRLRRKRVPAIDRFHHGRHVRRAFVRS